MTRAKVISLRDRKGVDDRPGAVLLRNSTPKQVDNPRSLKAEQIARELLERRGIRVGVVLDEQGTSGKSLANRPVAKKLVDEVEAGKWAAVAMIETSRASRDPDGIDQRVFKRACRIGHALLLTESKAYDFRNESDDLQFEVQAVFDAKEWRTLRRRTFEGNVERARLAPTYFGFAPFGYRPVPGTVTIRGTTRTIRLLERDPKQAALMEAIGRALDEEDGVSNAARRLNREGWCQPNGSRWYWSQVQQVLKRPIYVGRYEYGRFREAEDLWEEKVDGPIEHDLPDLAWYDQVRMARWQRKFTGKGPVRVRPENRPHPLLGTLVCRLCRRPMISQGPRGYCCTQWRQHGCTGQNLSNKVAEGAVREMLARVLPDLAELTGRVKAVLESDGRPDLPGDLRALDREISARFELEVEWKLKGVAAPPDFADKVKQLQAQRTALAAKLEDLGQAEAERQRLLALMSQFIDADGFLLLFDGMSASEQQATLRELFEWIVVETNGGRGNRARGWVSEYQPRFPNSSSELDPWTCWLNRLDAAS